MVVENHSFRINSDKCKLPRHPQELGKKEPLHWYYYDGTYHEPHQSSQLNKEFVIMAVEDSYILQGKQTESPGLHRSKRIKNTLKTIFGGWPPSGQSFLGEYLRGGHSGQSVGQHLGQVWGLLRC